MLRSKWRWPKRIGLLLAALLAAGVICVPFILPALAAYVCPACYGFERVTPTLFVEAAMRPEQRAELQAMTASAEARVAGFYGSFDGKPAILACASEACDRKLGGKGARAVTFTTLNGSFIRISPRGLNETILAHEFSHVELYRRIGLWKLLADAVPAWFDEGVAVIVSNDARYLKPGETAAARCVAQSQGPLPESHFTWGAAAGKTPGLYAQAACKVLVWMEANGGRQGLLAALAGIAEGQRGLP